MASGYDSDVLVVEDDSRRQQSDQRSNSSSFNRKGNFCIERNGVPQGRPMQTRVSTELRPHDPDNPSIDEHYRKRRTERRTKSAEFPQKRTRPSAIHNTNEDLDVIEVEESTQKATASHRRESAPSNLREKRHSLRLQEKRTHEKAWRTEYNFTVLRSDRQRRNGKREGAEKGSPSDDGITENPIPGGHGDPIVLDDEDEQHRSVSTKTGIPASDLEEKRNSGKTELQRLAKTSDRDHDIVPVGEDDEENEYEDDEIKESKNSSAVDAPYTGSTHLIFEFPPGQRGKIRVTEEERGRLRQKKYLNDSLIDFYIKYHETDIERRAHELRFSAAFFSSFFFGRLRRTEARIDYQGVRGWTKNVDIFSKRFVFVPICESYHWSLIIVANLDKVQQLVDSREEVPQTSPEAPRIIYLDSLDPKRGTEFGETMRLYLVEEWLAKRLGSETNPATRKATSMSFKKIISILRPNVPIQTNEYDCGLYVLNSFEMFLNNTDGLRDKLVSGYRDVRNAYSHVEIAMLRKSIINLMDILERQWSCEQETMGKESTKSPYEDVKSSTVYEFEADRSGVYHLAPSYENFDVAQESSSDAMLTSPRKLAHKPREEEECARHSSVEHEAANEQVTVLDGNESGEGQLEVATTGYVTMDVENSTGADG